MAGRLAIIAASGDLSAALAAAWPDALRIVLKGVAHDLPPPHRVHRLERLGALFADLAAQGVGRIVLAGAMQRPALDPAAMDAETAAIAPRLAAAMQCGDDHLLRFVITLFEERGIAVVGAHTLLPDLTAAPGLLAGPDPSQRALDDAARAGRILAALGPLDVGQGAVVAGGLCLGIETLQGTDAMLRFVADTPRALRLAAGGVLVKAPKAGQDLRVDMPAIGPETVRNAAQAGLEGIVIAARQVLVVDRPATILAADRAGLFILAQAV